VNVAHAQRPCCCWLTGLPGAGKSTLAVHVANSLESRGYRVIQLDGDVLREGLGRNLGFTPEDRAENVRRTGEVARLLVESGLVVIVSLISPGRAERDAAMERIGLNRCFEVYVDASPEVCAERDPKGLYALARAGKLRGLTGWDAPYEAPYSPTIHIRTAETPIKESAERIERHYLNFDNHAE